MTIQKRLFWSNLFMIAIPALLTAIVGLLCVGIIWLAMMQGAGFGVEDGGDFYLIGRSAANAAGQALSVQGDEREQQFAQLTTLLDADSMHLAVRKGEQILYTYGQAQEQDNALLLAAEHMTGEALLICSGERGVYRAPLSAGEHGAILYLFGTPGEHIGQDLRPVAVLSCLLVLLAVVCSVLLTNRFLTRFVLRHIEEPLDLLAAGARRLGTGDLDARISYSGQDEFTPVCHAFNEMARRLQESISRTCRDEASRRELLAGISHDLRSPLTSIRAYVEGLLDGVARTPARQRKYLETIRSKTEDIDRLVSQLFLFSELELDDYPQLIQRVELSQWISRLIGEVQSDYLRQGLAIRMQLTPAAVEADPEQLRRVLLNLLDNSAKYKDKPDGMAEITVAVREADVSICVADDGPGVPDDALSRLFDPFYRSDPARKNPAGGSGLGLAIAARAVQNMGGHICARNRASGGLIIEITLRKDANPDAENPDY